MTTWTTSAPTPTPPSPPKAKARSIALDGRNIAIAALTLLLVLALGALAFGSLSGDSPAVSADPVAAAPVAPAEAVEAPAPAPEPAPETMTENEYFAFMMATFDDAAFVIGDDIGSAEDAERHARALRIIVSDVREADVPSGYEAFNAKVAQSFDTLARSSEVTAQGMRAGSVATLERAIDLSTEAINQLEEAERLADDLGFGDSLSF